MIRLARSFRSAAVLGLGLTCLIVPGVMADAADDRTPPPIPDAGSRARFVEHHRALPDDAQPRAVHDEYDALHYDVSLSMDTGARVLYGTVIIEADPLVADLVEMDVDLFDNMTIDAVTAGGFPAAHSRLDDVVTIVLDDAYQPGETVTVSVTYHGTPSFPGSPLPFRFSQHAGVPMVLSYSEPFGGPAWWAQKDDPKDKATLALHYTVDDGLVAVSNGLLESVVDNGDGTDTYNWRTDYPMSPYLFSIAVTNFESWSEDYVALDEVTTMEMTYWAYPEDLSDAQVSWSYNLEMMEYYASIFGEYPFLDEKYGIAEFQHPGAMEHQTCTSMGANWVTGTHANDFVVAHELSHAWVGDMITMVTWSHAWTKEGFATYCEALYFEDKYGTTYYHDYMADIPVWNHAEERIYDMANPLDAAIYYKGAWVLHMLRHVVGDANFFTAIRAYADDERYRYSVSDTDDLREAFETASGMDLVPFFDQWVYSPGYPIYQVDWSAAPAALDGHEVTLTLEQTQTLGPIFRMPIDIEVVTDLGSEFFTVGDSLVSQTFVLSTTGLPQAVIVDPEVWILREIDDVVDVAAVPAIGSRLQARNRPNPFASTGTWIDFEVPDAGSVHLEVFDPGGRQVRVLLSDERSAGHGRVRWDGTDSVGRVVAPGVYYYRLVAGGQSVTRRMVLLH